MNRPRILALALLLFLFVKPLSAQHRDSIYYRNELRVVIIEPGISWVHSFTKQAGLQFTGAYVGSMLCRSYPLADNLLLPIPQFIQGKGYTFTAAARLRINTFAHFLIGGGYRYFNSDLQSIDATFSGESDLTSFLMQEKSNAALGFVGFDIHNSSSSRLSVAFTWRLGISGGTYQLNVKDEHYTYHGSSQPGLYDPAFPAPPFTKSSTGGLVYMHVGASIGWRFGAHDMPPDMYDTPSEKKDDKSAYISDNSEARHTLFLEFAGTAGPPFSINYEYRLKRMQAYYLCDLGLRTGFGFRRYYYSNTYRMPLLMTFSFFPAGSVHLETGIGMLFERVPDYWQPWQKAISGELMLKYQVKHRGLLFRAGWTPNFFFNASGFQAYQLFQTNTLLTFGIAAGYTF